METQELLRAPHTAATEFPDSALAARTYSTYSSFPTRLYERFVNLYVKPFAQSFQSAIDLGCGSGGLVEVLNEQYDASFLGVDVSELSIERCRENPRLDRPKIAFLCEDIAALGGMENLRNRFDLLVSYSALHLVHRTTAEKFDLLKNLTKPGAILAIDAVPNITWNLALFSFIRFLFQAGIGGFAIRMLGPIVAPNMPKDFIQDLSKLNYIKTLRLCDFVDVAYFRSADFLDSFEVLRWDFVAQDGVLTGRKLRMTLRRK